MRINKKILALGILVVLTMQIVVALGVTPGRTTIKFPGDIYREFEFNVLNSEGKNFDIEFTTGGELGEYITLDKKQHHFGDGEDSKKFSYTLNIPFGLDLSPGDHKGQVVIAESLTDPEAAFGAKMAVATEVLLKVPYPNKYVEAAVDVIEADKGEATIFLIPIINRGNETVEQVVANVDIYRFEEVVGSVKSNSVSLGSQERSEIQAEWIADVPIGMYRAFITVFYENITISYWEEFQVGKLSIGVFDLFVESFELGNVVKMDILVENEWGERLKEVYAELVLYDENGVKIVDVLSAPYDLEPGERTRIPLYWDTFGLEKGEYNGKIIIHYKEFTSSRDLYVDISEYGIGLELSSGGFVLEKEWKVWKSILVGIIIFLIIFLVIYRRFIYKK